MQPTDAAEISGLFFGAGSSERALILHNLSDTPLKASPRIPAARGARAIETLEMAAFAADVENFTLELGESLILPWKVASQVVDDPGGEPLACAAKALGMPSPVFQRVLLFLKPEIGTSVHTVYRLSRLYDGLSERSALIMLAAWRGSTMAVTRAKYRPTLYDDERNRARPAAAQNHPATQLPGIGAVRGRARKARGASKSIFERSMPSDVIRERIPVHLKKTRENKGPEPRSDHQNRSGSRQIEKMPPRPILGLHDPDIRVESDFLLEPLFHGLFRHGLF